MSAAFARYRRLDDELAFIRWIHRGLESEEEDRILDDMEQVWWELEEQERELLQSETPRSLILSRTDTNPTRKLVDSDKECDPSAPTRRIEEAA